MAGTQENQTKIEQTTISSQAKGPGNAPLVSAAASDILEEIPSWMARGIIYLLALIFLSIILYSYFGKMDVLVQGRGKLIPKGDAAIVQAVKPGLLNRLHVKEGSNVEKGQVLAEFDITKSNIDAKKRTYQFERKKKEKACLEYTIEAMVSVFAGEKVNVKRDTMLQICENEYLDQIASLRTARDQYETSLFSAKKLQPDNLTGLENMVKSKELILKNKQLALKAAQAEIKRAESRQTLYKEMYEQGLTSKIKLMEEQKQYDEVVSTLNQAREEVDTAQSSLIQARSKRHSTGLHYIQKNRQAEDAWQMVVMKHEAALKNMRRKLENLNLAIADFELDSQLQDFSRKFDRILAPVTGTVSSVALNTPGELVKSGSTIFTINPSGQPLVAQVMIPNRSIGQLKPGLKTKLKLDAFPYQNYGVLTGRVIEISPDSRKIETDYVYEVTIALDRDYMEKNNKKHVLFTGLTLKAEIVVETRRIIENFLDPLRKLRN